MVLSITLMPVLATLALPKKIADHDIWLVRVIKSIYRPIVMRSISHPFTTAAIALMVFAVSLPVGAHLGGEFMPKLSEGDILIEANRLPSASLEGAIGMSTQIETLLKEHFRDEVRTDRKSVV